MVHQQDEFGLLPDDIATIFH